MRITRWLFSAGLFLVLPRIFCRADSPGIRSCRRDLQVRGPIRHHPGRGQC
jgi:hypothetical protein